MKALTIKQPWASLIAEGIKDIENRTWKTKFRGKIYIHAAAIPDKRYKDLESLFTIRQKQFLFPPIFHGQPGYDIGVRCKTGLLITSAIIGEVDIVDCVINHKSIWAEKTMTIVNANPLLGPDEDDEEPFKPIYNWVLANPVLYPEPILNVKGKLSFWEYEPIKTTPGLAEKAKDAPPYTSEMGQQGLIDALKNETES